MRKASSISRWRGIRRGAPVALSVGASLTFACAGANVQSPYAERRGADARPSTPGDPKAAAGPSAPTVEEAKQFTQRVDSDLRKLWTARERAMWVSQNFITGDTQAMAAAEEERSAAYMSKAIGEATRFDGLDLPPDVARQLKLLRLAETAPAPSDPKERAELAELGVWLTSEYGKGKYCPERLKGECLTLDDLSKIMSKSRDYDKLLDAWKGWRSISPPMREKYARYVELGNKGAKEIGFSNMGALWRSGYDMTPADFEVDVERLWRDVRPLYDELHCYVRARLSKKYGSERVPESGPIPAHLLGNMWAQEWTDLYDMVEPYPGQASLDVTKALKAKKYDAKKMVELGEAFFTSLGLDKLPKTFWERSLFTRPRDRDVVCHASAWDVGGQGDLRIKMCIEPTEQDLITIHHELGHNYYYLYYKTLPALFQAGANDGFHEGIGDTLALSVTPAYLKKLGLLAQAPENEKAELNHLMKMALDKVAFLPFGLLVDKWRWDVFSGRIKPAEYNSSWWALRKKYQGVTPPIERSESDFDPGAKYHIPGGTPYMRYFLARIYQFQFHKALCDAAGHKGPLHTCSIHGNHAAGDKLKRMLSMGASKPWPEAMRAVTGGDRADAGPMLEYFAPLRKFLEAQNKGKKCGF